MALIPNLEQVKEIVESSVWYPSGDNCQPWTFSWGKQKLRIYHNSERAVHPLNPAGIMSCISLGCLVEGLSISASQFGCQTKVQYHDFSQGTEVCWATVEFLSIQRPEDPLLKFIRLRSADRRLFNKGELPIAAIEERVKLGDDLLPAQMHFLRALTPEVTDYIVNAEKLMVDDAHVLPKVLEWTRFSRSEALRWRDGLSLKNMGIKLWEAPALKLIKEYPPALQYMKWIMTPQHMARVREQLNTSAGLLCISIPKVQTANVPNAGRMMLRAWLELTKLGFGVQPLTIASTLVFCAQAGLIEQTFSQEWIRFFKDGEAIMRKIFKLPEDHLPIWMIRTGQASPLPAELRTLRKPIESILSFEK